MGKMRGIKAYIRQRLDDIRIVDSHEHLGLVHVRGPKLRGFRLDLPFFFARSYLRTNLISSGLKESSLSLKSFEYLRKPLDDDESEERWKEIKPYLDVVRNTIYYRYLLTAFHDLYGFESNEVDDSNWQNLSSKIREKSNNRLEWSLEVLNKMNLYKVILDNSTCVLSPNLVEDDRLVQGVKMDQFIRGSLQVVSNFTNVKVHSLDAFLDVLDQAFAVAKEGGAAGVKSVMAASRTLFFDDVAKSDAERIFSKGLGNVNVADRKMFEDFMMHAVCDKCSEYKLPFQFHTGLQAGGQNYITNAKPTHLTNLFQKYPDVRFVLFHGGYPYVQEAGLMAKYFPNVYVDGCWLTHMSPAAYKRGLDEWLEIVPSNKIFAWGGDHPYIEMSYASLILAKDLVSEVLAAKVASGYFSKRIALSVAEKIMGENAIEMYGL